MIRNDRGLYHAKRTLMGTGSHNLVDIIGGTHGVTIVQGHGGIRGFEARQFRCFVVQRTRDGVFGSIEGIGITDHGGRIVSLVNGGDFIGIV
jgi:hypothetical protein